MEIISISPPSKPPNGKPSRHLCCHPERDRLQVGQDALVELVLLEKPLTLVLLQRRLQLQPFRASPLCLGVQWRGGALCVLQVTPVLCSKKFVICAHMDCVAVCVVCVVCVPVFHTFLCGLHQTGYFQKTVHLSAPAVFLCVVTLKKAFCFENAEHAEAAVTRPSGLEPAHWETAGPDWGRVDAGRPFGAAGWSPPETRPGDGGRDRGARSKAPAPGGATNVERTAQQRGRLTPPKQRLRSSFGRLLEICLNFGGLGWWYLFAVQAVIFISKSATKKKSSGAPRKIRSLPLRQPNSH